MLCAAKNASLVAVDRSLRHISRRALYNFARIATRTGRIWHFKPHNFRAWATTGECLAATGQELRAPVEETIVSNISQLQLEGFPETSYFALPAYGLQTCNCCFDQSVLKDT